MTDRITLILLAAALVGGSLLLPAGTARAQASEPNRHVLLIGGLGGNDRYAASFQKYLLDTRRAFVDQFRVPAENITVLAGSDPGASSFITGESTAENIRSAFGDLAKRVTSADQVFIILYGHGSFAREEARLNIPRRDLSDSDFAALLASIDAERIVFVNTTSSSGPFIESLSGSDRIIITATRSGRQQNETRFPRHFIDALSNPEADLDQNDRLSVREAFQFAADRTAQSFEDEGHIPSEHALLDDTGDGEGTPSDELSETPDGNLAAVTYFEPAASEPVAGADPNSTAAFRAEKRALEKKIAELKSKKGELSESDYYDQLEDLLIRLARISQPADSAGTTP